MLFNMHFLSLFSRIKERSPALSITVGISKGSRLALSLCRLLGIASVLLVLIGASPISGVAASKPDDRSGINLIGRLSETLAKTALSVLRPLVLFRPIAMACTTWQATSGSGAVTGTGLMPILRRQAKTFAATRLDPRKVLIRQIPTHLSVWSKGAPSFATPLIVRVIVPAHAGAHYPTPVRPIRVSGA
jgi:hypothetical protein